MMMKKMLYVFELNATLFSISTLNWREFVVTFNEGTIEIKNKRILIVIEIVNSKMYMLQSINTAFLNNEAKIPKKLKKNDYSWCYFWKKKAGYNLWKKKQVIFRLWHERLGHLRSIQLKMLSMQMLSMNAINISDDFDCKVCNLFKLTKKVNRETQKRTSRKLKRVHTNVWNSYRTLNIENNRYFVFLIDDLIKKSWIALMKIKTKISKKIREWHAFVSL